MRRVIGVVALVGVSAWLVLGMVPAASAAGVATAINGMSFTADDGDVAAGATLTGYTGGTDVTIPNTVMIGSQNYNVTAIGDFAFYHDGLTSVVLPDHLTSIGIAAFAQDALTAIQLPGGLTEIDEEAFLNNQLGAVNLPDSVTTLGREAFLENHLTSVVIGSGITTLPFDVFAVNSVTSVSIPSSVTTIGVQAFYSNNLTSVSFGGSVTSIGTYAFGGNNLVSIDFQAPLAVIGDSAFVSNDLTSVTFPATLTTIGEGTFDGNPDLDSVTFTGPAPSTISPTPGAPSLGSAPGLIVHYSWAYGAAQRAGGFTNTTWQGYTTQDLVTTTFDLRGHGSPIAPQIIAAGDAPIRPPAPTATAWVFKGWYADATLSTPASFSAGLTADQTLFASWKSGAASSADNKDPQLAVTGDTVDYAALLAAALSAIVGGSMVFWSRRRRNVVG